MKKWAFCLFCNEPFIEKAFQTIYDCRTRGEWKDDIILLVSSGLFNRQDVKDMAVKLKVILREIKDRSFDKIMEFWKKIPSHSQYNYIITHEFMYNKFHVFDSYFKQWDFIFYLDSGARIHGSLERMKQFEPDNCIYGHSDIYPNYTNTLSNQFDFTIMTPHEKFEILYNYNLSIDYFQGTMFIYDTQIIEENTVERLFELANKYPSAIRMDQGILNLYFTCERKLWKQIPIKDKVGFLYDYHERPGFRGRDYLILKAMYGPY